MQTDAYTLFRDYQKEFPKSEQPREMKGNQPFTQDKHTENTQHKEGERMSHTHEHGAQSRSKIGQIIKEIFGQFFTAAFWKDFFKTLVQESLKSFLVSAGQTLIFVGRRDQSVQVMNAGVNIPMNSTTSMVNKAFGTNPVSTIPSAPNMQTLKNFGFNN